MRKEILFAILLGILLGSIILYGTYIANKATSNLQPTAIVQTPDSGVSTPTIPSENTPATLKITFPYNNYVSFSDKINITGIGPLNSPIAVITEKDENIVYTDNQGKFDLPVVLIGGENTITLSIPSLDTVETTTLSVIYTTADIKF